MNDTPGSGSRWEPGPDEQITQRLSAPDVVPGLTPEPEAQSAPSPRRFGKAVAAVAIVAAATVAGGAVGMAVVGNRAAEVSDTANQDTTDSGVQTPEDTAPGATAAPDGTTELPDGSGHLPDGSGQVPDGSGQVPDGSGQYPPPGFDPDGDGDGFGGHGHDGPPGFAPDSDGYGSQGQDDSSSGEF